MEKLESEAFEKFVFKNRGALLAVPAALLVLCGSPSAFSVAIGLPLAMAGELLRCWAVGYSGKTTRANTVTASDLVTAGPYAYVRNPLYFGNVVTAAGFAIAFTGKNAAVERLALIAGSLAAMCAVYATIIPHEERFLRSSFGEAFERYCDQVPALLPQLEPMPGARGTWQGGVIAEAESKTFVTFAAMLLALAAKALKA
jgi:protein-S-isoprenylcysteine O-methyltransferase Ste14